MSISRSFRSGSSQFKPWIEYCMAAASSPLAPPKLFQQHVAETWIRCADVYGVHQFLYVVIHESSLRNICMLAGPRNTRAKGLLSRYAFPTRVAIDATGSTRLRFCRTGLTIRFHGQSSSKLWLAPHLRGTRSCWPRSRNLADEAAYGVDCFSRTIPFIARGIIRVPNGRVGKVSVLLGMKAGDLELAGRVRG